MSNGRSHGNKLRKANQMEQKGNNPPSTKKGFTKAVPKEEPEQKNDRYFVGGGWDNSGEYGVFLNLQLSVEKLADLEPDEYGNIRLTVAQRKNPDEKSKQNLMVYEKE